MELLVGYLLARAGVPFDFGEEGGSARSQPDFSALVDDFPMSIEVTSRRPEGLITLMGEMERDLADFPVLFQLHLSSWTRLSREDRRQAIETLRSACVHIGEGPTKLEVDLPSIGGAALLTAPAEMEILAVGVEFDTDIEAAEVVLVRAIEEKAQSFRAGDWAARTVLVVDLANVGYAASSRPPMVWAGVLEELVSGLGDLPFVAVAVVISSFTSVALQGAICTATGVDRETSLRIARLAEVLGLVLPLNS